MPVVPSGSLNNTALIVPDLYVEIVPPQNLIINGVPTNTVGVVGTSSWGPVNTPAVVGSMAEFYLAFGPINPRKYDLGSPIAIAVQQGAQSFYCVRVTDGTDTKAESGVPAAAATITALYSGALGNQITVTLGSGSQAGSWALVVQLPGVQPEVFDNIAGAGGIFWQNLQEAVNAGAGVQRGASKLITMQANGTVTTPSPFNIPLGESVAGSDGAMGVGPAQLVGNDGAVRTGMYALRGTGCSLVVVSDADDPQTWTTQAQFGLDEGAYVILTGPAGDSISNAISVKGAAGLDTYAAKIMFGDWIWWSDQANGLVRLVSPQGFVAGRLANLSPEQSSLNKQLFGVIATQSSGLPRSGQFSTYSRADLAALLQAGIDVITNPQPGGTFWGVRGGRNASSDLARKGDNYARLTNYISRSLSQGMGRYVGQVISDTLFLNIRGTLLSFLQNMLSQGLLGSTGGTLPYSVICDGSNNPQSRTGLGYVQADVQVQYQAINEIFIVNLEGGQAVQITKQTLPNGQRGQ